MRVRPVRGFGYLGDRDSFQYLVALGRSVPGGAYLVDAGDAATEAAHAQARRSQAGERYTRERLQAPRFTYFDEISNHSDDTHTLAGGPFLDLIVGGESSLDTWYRRYHDGHDKRVEVSIHDSPLDLHCHTPLNQRLAPDGMRLCRELVDAADTLIAAFPDGTAAPLLAAGCFIRLVDALELDGEQKGRLCDHGFKYLSQYLECSSTATPSDVRARRVEQVREAADFARAALSTRPGAGLRIGLSADDDRFFFPESVWLQFHWLVSSLPVGLVQELALAEALSTWVSSGDGDQ
ncbi:hypothetical protein [Catenulispora pinisilvae]|uniref:hypothetical protein n=1 Tax=Catenulispora pinisilvae TaxID=2705253 RepID=UPI001890CA0F|nr:hypothetical protein [Catenulispora pinisilvae]